MGTEVCDLPTFERLPNLDTFIVDFEVKEPKQQRLLALDVSLKATPSRWWDAHN